MTKTVSLWKAYKNAPDIKRSEKSAAGTMPAAAFQYCEAMRTASSFGWYVYPPKDISLVFDGRETYYHEDGHWHPLKSFNFEDDFRVKWNAAAPDELFELDPPFITGLFEPGGVQIWSGYFVSTAPGWSLLVRPPVNTALRSAFSAYEGIVETDSFKPWPLFINLKLRTTDREIYISKNDPLFQMQPIPQVAYSNEGLSMDVNDNIFEEDNGFNWSGLDKTVRKVSEKKVRRPGSYAVQRRKEKP